MTVLDLLTNNRLNNIFPETRYLKIEIVMGIQQCTPLQKRTIPPPPEQKSDLTLISIVLLYDRKETSLYH